MSNVARRRSFAFAFTIQIKIPAQQSHNLRARNSFLRAHSQPVVEEAGLNAVVDAPGAVQVET
jgi:hypothetical protein